MSDCFLGEIRLYAFDFAPKGWAACNGTVMQIRQNQALYALLGTYFGGDGSATFGLPDLQGRVPVGQGPLAGTSTVVKLGEKAGTETVPLAADQIPPHSHTVRASTTPGTTPQPANAVFGKPILGTATANLYASPGTWQALSPATVGNTGAGAGHVNMQPFAVTNFCIATTGYFPSRN